MCDVRTEGASFLFSVLGWVASPPTQPRYLPPSPNTSPLPRVSGCPLRTPPKCSIVFRAGESWKGHRERGYGLAYRKHRKWPWQGKGDLKCYCPCP